MSHRYHLLPLILLVAFGLAGSPGWAAPPKGKATPTPIPSEMPTFAEARIKFGQMFLKKKDYRQAEQEFRSATLIDPMNFDAAVGLADALYGRQNYRESLSEYQRALRIARPSWAVVPLKEAARLAGHNQIAAALRIYRKVAHIAPKAGEMLNKGVDALQAGDRAGAKKAFIEATKLDPDYADAYYKLGNMAYEDKAYNEAIDHYELAAKSDPSDGLIFFKLGNAFYRFQTLAPKGDKYNFYREWDRKSRDAKWSAWCASRAATAYRQASRLRPRDFDILFNLGVAEYDLNHATAAAKALEAAVLVRSDDPDAHVWLGNAYFQGARTIKAYNKAIKEYRAAITLDPKRYEVEYNLAQAYYQKSKIRPASDEFEITPATANFYYSKGAAYHKTHMLEEAGRHLQAYLDYAANVPNREKVMKLFDEIKVETARSVQGGGSKPAGHGGGGHGGGHGGGGHGGH